METFSIVDMSGFIKTVRDGAAKSLSENYTDNVDNYVTVGQIESMVKNKSVGMDDENNYMITEEIFDEIFESIRTDIYQSALSKLAASDKIECAWDDKTNEMIFWFNSKTKGEIDIKIKPSSDNE